MTSSDKPSLTTTDKLETSPTIIYFRPLLEALRPPANLYLTAYLLAYFLTVPPTRIEAACGQGPRVSFPQRVPGMW